MKEFGIDISHWQGNFDFAAAKNEGAAFAIIKAGGGDEGLYKDSKFERNYSAAKALGLPVGAYWYSKATTLDRAKKEAEFFYNIIKGKKLELPVFMDVEEKAMLKLSPANLTDIAEAFCEYLEAKSLFVGIYASLNTFKVHLEDSRLAKYTHWVAQWAKKCTYQNKDILGFWQFGGETNPTRTNKVAGVVCDQNYMYTDFPKIIKEKGFNGFSKPAPTQVKSVSDLATEVLAGLWGNGAERKKRLTEAGYDYNKIQAEVDRRMSAKPSAALPAPKVGDLVSILPAGVIYGTNKPFAPFVYTTLLYVREISGARAVVSTLPNGPITGAVDVKYLKKYVV